LATGFGLRFFFNDNQRNMGVDIQKGSKKETCVSNMSGQKHIARQIAERVKGVKTFKDSCRGIMSKRGVLPFVLHKYDREKRETDHRTLKSSLERKPERGKASTRGWGGPLTSKPSSDKCTWRGTNT